MVWTLLDKEGLLYDLERRIIVGLKPRTDVLAILALGLEATAMWEQHGENLWLRENYWPPKLDKEGARLPSQPPALPERNFASMLMGSRWDFLPATR